jgi:hypothetical protein
MTRTFPRLRPLGLCLALVLAGCGRGPTTPEEAHQRLSEAVAARDGGILFDALDIETRWSWMTVQRAQRETYDIVLSNFPEGGERERTLRRYEQGAESEDARDLFVRQLDPAAWSDLARAVSALGAAPHLVVNAAGDRAEASAGGQSLVYQKGPGHAGWGYAGFLDAAEQIKRRALADLQVLRTSAADYERAAARQNR